MPKKITPDNHHADTLEDPGERLFYPKRNSAPVEMLEIFHTCGDECLPNICGRSSNYGLEFSFLCNPPGQ